jgi:hypothetical protein
MLLVLIWFFSSPQQNDCRVASMPQATGSTVDFATHTGPGQQQQLEGPGSWLIYVQPGSLYPQNRMERPMTTNYKA